VKIFRGEVRAGKSGADVSVLILDEPFDAVRVRVCLLQFPGKFLRISGSTRRSVAKCRHLLSPLVLVDFRRLFQTPFNPLAFRNRERPEHDKGRNRQSQEDGKDS
jgi:hypothetical protein